MKVVALWVCLLAGVAGVAPQEATDPPRGTSTDVLAVVLLLDVTSSISHMPLALDQRYAAVYNAMLRRLRPADRAAVGVIAARPRLSPLMADRKELTASVRRLLDVGDADRLGPSPLWDALDAAITLVADDRSRHAVILFSDGKSSGNMHGLDDVREHAAKSAVSIHAVVEPSVVALFSGPAPAMPPGGDELLPVEMVRSLTAATGGLCVVDMPVNRRSDAAGAIGRIMDGLQR